jgi:putative oxidoreductase
MSALRSLKSLERYADVGLLVMRAVTGLLFMTHGAQKILGVLGGHHPALGSQLWVGGVIELLGGALIALGLFTRPAAFLASGTMAVAYVQFHWKLETGRSFFPVINKGELAVVYAVVFLYLVFAGAGRYSLDAMFSGRRR